MLGIVDILLRNILVPVLRNSNISYSIFLRLLSHPCSWARKRGDSYVVLFAEFFAEGCAHNNATHAGRSREVSLAGLPS